MPKAQPKNVPGPFYVEYDCCLTCGIPIEIAPDNFQWDEADTYAGCFVSRQPTNDQEVGLMIEVMKQGEVDCLRYRGSDDALIRRLAIEGLASQCD